MGKEAIVFWKEHKKTQDCDFGGCSWVFASTTAYFYITCRKANDSSVL